MLSTGFCINSVQFLMRKQVILQQFLDGTIRKTEVQNWLPLVVGELKLNVDAFLFKEATSFMVGMMLIDHTGQFVQGKNMRFPGLSSVLEAESVDVFEALSWVMPLVDQPVSIECDSLLTVDAVCRGEDY